MWEMAKICRKWLKYLTNGLTIWEIAQIYGAWLKYLKKQHKYVKIT